MLRTRVIPVLLLRGESIVKTRRFGEFQYIGDPCNTVRIFNELEVDEIVLLDILASRENRGPNLELLRSIASECYMPLAYGGGISNLDEARNIFTIGIEKVILNTGALQRPSLISEIAEVYGSQAVIASIDVAKRVFGRQEVRSRGGTKAWRLDPVSLAREFENRGAGEILLTAIGREGTWSGFDLDLIRKVSDAVTIPVIAHGGAGRLQDLASAVTQARASAVALGSMVVFQRKGMGVLINFPAREELEGILP